MLSPEGWSSTSSSMAVSKPPRAPNSSVRAAKHQRFPPKFSHSPISSPLMPAHRKEEVADGDHPPWRCDLGVTGAVASTLQIALQRYLPFINSPTYSQTYE